MGMWPGEMRTLIHHGTYPAILRWMPSSHSWCPGHTASYVVERGVVSEVIEWLRRHIVAAPHCGERTAPHLEVDQPESRQAHPQEDLRRDIRPEGVPGRESNLSGSRFKCQPGRLCGCSKRARRRGRERHRARTHLPDGRRHQQHRPVVLRRHAVKPSERQQRQQRRDVVGHLHGRTIAVALRRDGEPSRAAIYWRKRTSIWETASRFDVGQQRALTSSLLTEAANATASGAPRSPCWLTGSSRTPAHHAAPAKTDRRAAATCKLCVMCGGAMFARATPPCLRGAARGGATHGRSRAHPCSESHAAGRCRLPQNAYLFLVAVPPQRGHAEVDHLLVHQVRHRGAPPAGTQHRSTGASHAEGAALALLMGACGARGPARCLLAFWPVRPPPAGRRRARRAGRRSPPALGRRYSSVGRGARWRRRGGARRPRARGDKCQLQSLHRRRRTGYRTPPAASMHSRNWRE